MLGEYVLVLAKVAEKRVEFIFLFYDVQMDFLGVDDFSFPCNLYEKGNSVL